MKTVLIIVIAIVLVVGWLLILTDKPIKIE